MHDDANTKSNDAAGTESDDTAMLLDFVRDHDAQCPLCGYNLRALTRPVCPECRQDLVLAVGVKHILLGWFIFAAAPCLFSGLAALALLAIIVIARISGDNPPPVFYFMDIFGLISGIAALVLVVFRIRFIRLSRRTQRLWALGIWLIHFAMLGWVLTIMFP